MPTYNYRCNQCKIEFSIFKGINDTKIDNCPDCSSNTKIERIITGGTGMIFKGDGFYLTDNKTKNSDSKNENLKTEKKQ